MLSLSGKKHLSLETADLRFNLLAALNSILFLNRFLFRQSRHRRDRLGRDGSESDFEHERSWIHRMRLQSQHRQSPTFSGERSQRHQRKLTTEKV